MTTIILGIFEEGQVYAIMALGVYITYRILDFPDLSVDGTLPEWSCFYRAVLRDCIICRTGTLPLPFSPGRYVGMCQWTFHVNLSGMGLLSGIIVMTALYSINLRVAGNSTLPEIFIVTFFIIHSLKQEETRL